MKLEVLVTSMFQKDFSLVKKMNIQTDAIIANQCDVDKEECVNLNNRQIKLLSTATRGASKNRNIAINNSKGDLLLFADDDLVFDAGYEQVILNEFACHPNADAIKFNLYNLSQKRKISMKKINKFEKATRKNMSSSGVWGLAIKKEVLLKAKILFDENFGPGTDDYCGEDTIFIQELLKKHIKMYRSPVFIGGIDQTNSCWFEGYNKKYFFVTGKVFARLYPKLSFFLAVRSSFRFSKNKKCNLSFLSILKTYLSGIKEQKKSVIK